MSVTHTTPEVEAEANYFAMHLLVPTAALRSEYSKLGPVDVAGDDSALKKLAARFGVSTTLMAMRIAEEAL